MHIRWNIIIWNKDNTIHNCAFAVNMRSKLDWGIENVYYNEDERILFQVTEMTTQCPSKIEMYKTTEGLYLMVNKDLNEKQKEDVMKMKVKNTEIKTAYWLMMAEQDSDKDKVQKTIMEINLRSCYSFTNNLAINII